MIEGREMALEVARLVARVGEEFGIPAIFKASFDKALILSAASVCRRGWQFWGL